MVAMATAIALNLFHLLRMKRVLGGAVGMGGGGGSKGRHKVTQLKGREAEVVRYSYRYSVSPPSAPPFDQNIKLERKFCFSAKKLSLEKKMKLLKSDFFTDYRCESQNNLRSFKD